MYNIYYINTNDNCKNLIKLHTEALAMATNASQEVLHYWSLVNLTAYNKKCNMQVIKQCLYCDMQACIIHLNSHISRDHNEQLMNLITNAK